MSNPIERLEGRTLFAATTPVTIQAEAATVYGAVVATGATGYTGSGFVDYQHAAGDYVEWTVNADAAGTHRLSFRYANGSGDRPLELKVNGQVVRSRLSFPNSGSWNTWGAVAVDVPLPAGSNRVRLTSVGSNGPNVDALTVTPPAQPEPEPEPQPQPTNVYQAEYALRSGATMDRAHAGYTGTGYVDYGSTTGGWVEWTVDARSAGTHRLTFRYANGVSDRPLELKVNGQVIRNRQSFPGSGSWSAWRTVTADVALNAGPNRVRLTTVGFNGGNLDSLTVAPLQQPEPEPQPEPTAVYQAELATRYAAGMGTSHTGYTGTGYVDYNALAGAYVEWAVNAATAGTRTLTFRYANGRSVDRPLELRVNGSVAVNSVSFLGTGAWTNWRTVSVPVRLAAGTNRIRLTSIPGDGPNLDSMTVATAVAEPSLSERLNDALDFAAAQLRRTAAEIPTDRYVNYTNADGTWHLLARMAWESGFLPGSMWQMYRDTGETFFREQATARTLPLEAERDRRWDGTFVLFNTFKPLYDLTGNSEYRQILLDVARNKAGQFNEKVGAFIGWHRPSESDDPRADVGFYVDLMADLDTIIWAAKETGNQQWLDLVERHAATTARYFVRPDGSTYHWAYFTDEGEFVRGEQYQGYADESTWSRGQAWAIYGFINVYRETGNPLFLETARKTADWFIANLPADKVPYWDFNDPRIPNAYKDSSAAAIAASGMLELARLRSGTSDATRYRAAAESILSSLAGPSYLARGSNSRGILLHAALNVPTGVGTDTSFIAADYFFLEAINRYFGR